jgi:hypothetical protein
LDTTTFRKVMESMEPSSKFKIIKLNMMHLLHGVRIWTLTRWNAFRDKEEYVITKNKEM